MSEPIPQSESQLFGGGETPNAPKAPGLGEQLMGVFTDPVALFKKLHDAPSWGWALGAIIVASLIMTILWGLKVDVDAMLRPILEKNPQIAASQIDSIIDMQSKFILPFSILGVLFATPIGVALVALIYWLLGMVTAENDKPSYLQALSATTVSGLVGVPYALLVGLMCLLRRVGGLTVDKLSPASIGYYLHPENVKLYALLNQVDIFLIAGFVMTYFATRHTMRLKVGGAILCTALGVILRVGLSVIFAK